MTQNSIPKYLLSENIYIQPDLGKNVHSNIIHDSQILGTAYSQKDG